MPGDFRHLPIPDTTFDVLVATFCLYHSTRPADVVAEIARCLVPGDRTLLATESVDNHREIDHLMVDTKAMTPTTPPLSSACWLVKRLIPVE